MLRSIRDWWKARQARKWANWLRDNKVILPKVPSWDRASKFYGEGRG